ncbi:nucleoside diphosphate kinase, partial [Ascosphaera pollenicola]
PTGATFTYNQGVILGAAAELYAYKSDDTYLDLAGKVADATIRTGSTFMHDGILGDNCDTSESCSGDGEEFKGPFVRNLRKLYLQDKKHQWKEFFETQAKSIWNNDMHKTSNGTCQLGLYWAGPYIAPGDPSVAQGIGLDAIIAAWTATKGGIHIL